VLLIDQHRRIQSVSVRRIRTPFILEQWGHDQARARAVFAQLQAELGFIQALSEELHHCGVAVPSSLPYPDGLIDAGMQAIAHGRIGVANVLPDNVAVTFEAAWPSEWYHLGMVVFTGPMIFRNVAIKLLNTPRNRQAFETALEHPIARRQPRPPPMEDAAGHFSGLTDEVAALAVRVAWLLETRRLGLAPRDASRRRLRLVWVEHNIATAGATISPAPAPRSSPAPAPAPTSNAPASVLPDDPGDVSPQAQALIAAAEDGTPFCEECARRAAELANAR
jgi:hypothetical protein